MDGLNLHDVVREAITSIHPDEECLLYQSTGRENVSGRLVPKYATPVRFMCQIQSDSDEKLYFSNREGENAVTRFFFLYTTREQRAAGIVRPNARGGDFLQRVQDGSWWLVVSVPEDFSGVAWEKVRAVLQVKGPDAPMPLENAVGGDA